jgi:hypothetical protein
MLLKNLQRQYSHFKNCTIIPLHLILTLKFCKIIPSHPKKCVCHFNHVVFKSIPGPGPCPGPCLFFRTNSFAIVVVFPEAIAVADDLVVVAADVDPATAVVVAPAPVGAVVVVTPETVAAVTDPVTFDVAFPAGAADCAVGPELVFGPD